MGDAAGPAEGVDRGRGLTGRPGGPTEVGQAVEPDSARSRRNDPPRSRSALGNHETAPISACVPRLPTPEGVEDEEGLVRGALVALLPDAEVVEAVEELLGIHHSDTAIALAIASPPP
jgi:hypothetical protein